MDLSNLLEPERIRCHHSVQSKKRTLQTVAELLGESLRSSAEATCPIGDEIAEGDEPRTASVRIASKILKARAKDEAEPEILTDMGILDALISRERLGSTGLGHGVGLPHSRLCAIEEPIAALVTLENGVDYEAADDQPVDLVFGLLVPEECNDEHLKILAELAKRFSDESLRDQLRSFTDPHALHEFLVSLPPSE